MHLITYFNLDCHELFRQSDKMIITGLFQLKYSILIPDLLDIKFFQKVKSDTQFSLAHVIEKGNCFYIYTYTKICKHVCR